MFKRLFKRQTIKRALDKGRYDGANNTRGEDFQEQVDHGTERAVYAMQRKATGPMRRLEAIKAHSEDRLAAASARLDEILSEGRPKALFYGLLLIAMCLGTICSEVYLLMPTMRGFGMAEPLHQFLTASGIVLMGATILKFVYSETRHYFAMNPEERAKAPNWKLQRVLLPCVAALILGGFLVLGMFRASEMIFANELDPTSALGQFVAQHETLTKAVLVFLTVMLPVAGAIALTHGIEIVKAWLEWTRLQYSAWLHKRRIHRTAKSLQSKQEQLDKQIEEQRQLGNEVKAEYRDGYNHGKQLGMHKLPVWFYVVKTVAVGLGFVFVAFLIDLWLPSNYELPGWRWIFYAAAVLGLTALYGVRQWLARERPSETDIRWKPRWRDEEAAAPTLPHGSKSIVFTQDKQLMLPGASSQRNRDADSSVREDSRRQQAA